MKLRSLTLVLVPLAAIVLALAWWTTRSDGGDDALAVGDTVGPETPADAGGAELVRPEPEGRGDEERAVPEVEDAPEPVRRIPDDSIWIEGRVVFPDGTPLDESAFVIARGKEFPDGERTWRVAVEPGGAFRAPFAAKTRRGTLDLDARYSYLDSRVKVDLRDLDEDVVIEPKLGGQILVTVLPPRAVATRSDALEGVFVRANGIDLSAGGLPRTGLRRVDVHEGGVFRVGGLPAELTWSVIAEHDRYADERRSEIRVAPGETVDVELAMPMGAVLRGRIVDERGTPLAGARVDVESDDVEAYGVAFEVGGEPVSDAEGRFELTGVPPLELRLSAVLDGYLDYETDLGAVGEGEVRDGLDVVLDEGGVIAGLVRWPDGRAAEGAHVGVQEARTGLTLSFGEDASAEADAEGRFRITGLRDVVCKVAARAKPVATEARPKPTEWRVEVEGVRPGSGPLVLVLSAGETVSGRVLDDRGEAWKSFKVVARERGEDVLGLELGRKVSRSFQSDDGSFELEGLEAGGWKLEATVKHNGSSLPVAVDVPGAGAVTLVVPRAARLAGLVVDSAGSPVAGATVEVVRPGERETVAFALLSATEKTKTRDDGTFSFPYLEPGPLRVTASADGHAASREAALELVPSEEREGLRLALRVAARITGEVHPAAGETSGRRIVCSLGVGVRHDTTSDAASEFAFEGLEPGEWRVILEPEIGVFDRGEVVMRSAERRTAVVDLTEGESAHVVLGAPAEHAVRLTGRVTKADRPVADIVVAAFPRDAGASGNQAAVKTDGDGRYALELPAPGDWVFNVGPSWGKQTPYVEEIPEEDEFQLDFVLPGGRVAGTVVDDSGAPIGEIDVTLSLTDGGDAEDVQSTRFVQTDADGAFEHDNLHPGRYLLRAGGASIWAVVVQDAAHGRVVLELELGEDEVQDGIVVELPPAGRIEGRVVDPAGDPVLGASVEVRDGDDRQVALWDRTSVDDTGSFRYPGLAPGTYRVRATAGDAASRWEEATVAAGAATPVTLVVD